MTEKDYAPLSTACVRGLCDKLYDKRKFAGGEIEKMVKDFSDANNTNQIKRLIRVLGQELMSSTNPNVKNGALMGLSSVAVGLGKECATHVGELTQPIVACLCESEARVRYAAVEALFNVLKIARGAALAHFPLMFDALARLAADPEPQVRHVAELLDRLLKDIVTESGTFDVGAFVPLVRERLYTRAAGARQFAVAWVGALDAAPALPLRRHLPDLLDGLFTILDDPNPEIRRMCDVQLNEFLRSIKKEPQDVDFQAMINILITHAQSPEELLQLTAITWMKEFLELAGPRMLPYASGILCAVLPCLAYGDDARKKIRETAAIVNNQLTRLVVSENPELEAAAAGEEGEEIESSISQEVEKLSIAGAPREEPQEERQGESGKEQEGKVEQEKAGELDLPAVVGVLVLLLHHSSVHTKAAALDWLLHLYTKLPSQMWRESEAVFASVSACLTDAAHDVVRRALGVLAELCTCGGAALEANPYYARLVAALVRLLAASSAALEERAALAVRQLCAALPAERVYRALARALDEERDVRFAARLVDALSAMLLCAPELHATRRALRAFDTQETHELFKALHGSWCHSPVALLALCLLTHNYNHCRRLIATFGELEITVEFLTEVDKLVQLIESPVFAYLRLELLGGEASAELRGALFALLMLLPQSAAFHALRQRLHTAPHHAYLLPSQRPAAPPPDIDFEALLQQFRRVQDRHRAARLHPPRRRR